MRKMPGKKSATILIVDDDPIILNLVKEQVSLYGYHPIMASSGKEAILAAEKQEKIHLLLTDIIMPEISGIELARQFIDRYPGIQVLFMSGHTCPPLDHYGIPDCRYDFVLKPFDTTTLISKITTVLDSRIIPPNVLFDA